MIRKELATVVISLISNTDSTCPNLFLIILLHESFYHAKVGFRSFVFLQFFALAAVLTVHKDNNQNEAQIEADEDDKLEDNHVVTLMLVIVVFLRGLRI